MGGIAQGVGAALFEEYVYADDAQPKVSHLCRVSGADHSRGPDDGQSRHRDTLSLHSPGSQGMWRGGHARHSGGAHVCDQRRPFGRWAYRARATPASPNRVWDLIQQANK